MADVGPGPSSLIALRIKAEIARLQHQKLAQELEVAENEERMQRLRDNIAATEREIEKQNGNLASLNSAEGVKNG